MTWRFIKQQQEHSLAYLVHIHENYEILTVENSCPLCKEHIPSYILLQRSILLGKEFRIPIPFTEINFRKNDDKFFSFLFKTTSDDNYNLYSFYNNIRDKEFFNKYGIKIT